MADYTVQEISVSGLEPSLSAAASGDTIPLQGDQREFVVVNNGSGASIDVTIPAQTTSVNISGVGALDVADHVVAVPDGEERWIGPFTKAYANSAGKAVVNISDVTTVTAAAVRLPKAD